MAAPTCGQADHSSSADDLLAVVYCRRACGANGPIEANVALATAARPEAETVFLCIGSLRGERPDCRGQALAGGRKALAPTPMAFPRKRDHMTQASRVIELIRSCRVGSSSWR